MKNHGFSLLELLISLAILALIIAFSGPGLLAQLHKTQVKTLTLSLLEAMELTRTQAVAANTRTTMRAHDHWNNGWDVFIDGNSSGTREEHEKLLMTAAGTAQVRISASQPVKHYISYVGTGESRHLGRGDRGAFQAGTITLCPLIQGFGYRLILARGGRVRMQEISPEACANQE